MNHRWRQQDDPRYTGRRRYPGFPVPSGRAPEGLRLNAESGFNARLFLFRSVLNIEINDLKRFYPNL